MKRDVQEMETKAKLVAIDTLAGDLIAALVQEIKLLPDIWPKIGEGEQRDIIDRLRNRVTENVRQAVHIIASAERITVAADLAKVDFSAGGVKAVMTVARRDPGRLDLADSIGRGCLIVVADPGAFLGGADAVKPTPAQGDLLEEAGATAARSIIEQSRRRAKETPAAGAAQGEAAKPEGENDPQKGAEPPANGNAQGSPEKPAEGAGNQPAEPPQEQQKPEQKPEQKPDPKASKRKPKDPPADPPGDDGIEIG